MIFDLILNSLDRKYSSSHFDFGKSNMRERDKWWDPDTIIIGQLGYDGHEWQMKSMVKFKELLAQ